MSTPPSFAWLDGTPPICLWCLTIAALAIAASCGLAVLFAAQYAAARSKMALVRSALNADDPDFQVAKGGLGFGRYGYAWQLVLPAIGLVAASLAIFKGTHAPLAFLAITALLWVHEIVRLCVVAVLYGVARSKTAGVTARIRAFNAHVYSNLLKTKAFLAPLSKATQGPLQADARVDQAIQGAGPLRSAQDLARVMFTVNIYKHLSKLGTHHPLADRALRCLDPIVLLRPRQAAFADYLAMSGTLINDASDSTATKLSKLPYDPKALDEALVLAAQWTATANDVANTIDVPDVRGPFLALAVSSLAATLVGPFVYATTVWGRPREAQILDFVGHLARRLVALVAH